MPVIIEQDDWRIWLGEELEAGELALPGEVLAELNRIGEAAQS